MIDAEFLKEAASLGAQAAKVDTQKLPDGSDRLLISQNGEREIIDLLPPPRSHMVSTLNDFIRACKHYGTDKSSVWVNPVDCRLVCDDTSMRDSVIFPLSLSPYHYSLKDVIGKELTQADLIRFLRIDMAGCLSDPAILPRFRKIDFSRTSSGASTVEHGKESMGRSVEAAVQGQGDLPDEITVQIPLYSTAGEHTVYKIPLLLSINPDSSTFTITPKPLALGMAKQSHVETIIDRLVESDIVPCPVYRGTP